MPSLSAGTEPDHLFRARWQPGEDVAHKLDEDGRLLEKGPRNRSGIRSRGRPGEVVDASFRRERAEAPPLPLSLSVLQITAKGATAWVPNRS